MKKQKIIILAILIIMFVSLSIYLYKSNHNPVVLDEVILKQEIPNDFFAMYKEDEEGYTEVEGTKFLEGYVLNITESKCIDNNGNEINNALSYENDKVVLTTNKTVYCYLYFDKSLGLEIKEKKPNKLSEDIKGAMYRFQGQATDDVQNYICFGTSDKDTCTSDTDHYMYRIIGIEAETGRVKVIKKEALNSTVKWWDDCDTNITFPKSRIYEMISGSGFLTNSTYVPKGWEEKIATNTWMYGDMWSDDTIGTKQTGEGLFLAELGQKGTLWVEKVNEDDKGALPYVIEDTDSPYYGQTFYYIRHTNEKWTETFKGKVSLMYLHDYLYSVGDEAKCSYYYEPEEYEKCKDGWMHLSQNDESAPLKVEWTMTRTGWVNDWASYWGHPMESSGSIASYHLDETLSVRPVFYINASEELLSKDATGTITDPFIITE